MLYVVGGCSRSGKSTLAERMRVRHGVPWFPLDAIKMGLHLGAPSLRIHPEEDDLDTADRMWPIIKGLLEHLEFDGRDYLIGNRSAPLFGQAGIGEGSVPRLALATAFSIKVHGFRLRRRQVSMTLRMAA